MSTLIFKLLIIGLICTMGIDSGFFETIDDWIYRKWKPYHLPYPFKCSLCATWWCSLLFIVFTGNFSLLGILLCLVNAYLTKIWTPLIALIENILFKIIEIFNKAVNRL